MKIKNIFGITALSLATIASETYAQTRETQKQDSKANSSVSITVDSYKISDKLNDDKSRDVAIIGTGIPTAISSPMSTDSTYGPGFKAKPKPQQPTTILVVGKCSDGKVGNTPYDNCTSLDAVLQMSRVSNNESFSTTGSVDTQYRGNATINLNISNKKVVKTILVNGIYDSNTSTIRAYEVNLGNIKIPLYK